jgi:hypothetical protein
MSDKALDKIIQRGTTTAREAFTPNPAPDSLVLYIWYDTDLQILYIWDGSDWVAIGGPGL